MKTRTALCSTLLVVTAATACSSSDSADSKPAKATTRASSTPTTSVSAKADTGSPLKLGTGHHWTDTDLDGSHISGTTTALSYTQPAKVDLPDGAADFPDGEWAILEIKLCADDTSTNVQTAQGPWNLGFPDDSRLAAPGLSGGGVPKPEYPVDGATLTPGECLRGKITFSVEKGTRPDRIIYAVDGRDPVTWTVPKA
ncbi:hypothetical protein ACFY5C_33650 [Streptomyces sp. NPDC012935]|uniref:hypothetical protein n=1 Tax=Streptomyces sp. NPDC012935 TaxID=3364857 RepID=UPI00367CD495